MKEYVIAAALLAASLCGPVQATEKPGTGSLSGSVSPASVSVRIIVKVEGTEHRIKKNIKGEVTLAAGGPFAIHNLPPGRYDILFKPQGKSKATYMSDRWSLVDVEAGRETKGIHLRMTPADADHKIDEVIVQFKPRMTPDAIRRVLSEMKCILKDKPLDFGTGLFCTVDIPDNKTVAEMVKAFVARREVQGAEPNGIARIN